MCKPTLRMLNIQMKKCMIKIVLNNKQIFLCEDHHSIIRDNAVTNACILFVLTEQKALELVDTLLISEIQNAIVVGDIEANLGMMMQAFTVIKAAGGVVFNNKNELLFIYRRKKWDLPKGKLDEGESIEECAVREVYEETGLKNIEIVRKVCTTYHLYLENEIILKETTWYLMYTEDKWLTPQKEEGIKKVIWVHKNNIRFQLANTYQAIIDIFEQLLNEE